MGDPATTHDTASGRAAAEIDRMLAETRKFIAEQNKLSAEQAKFAAEQAKLYAEADKFRRDRFLAPILAAGALGGAVAAILAIMTRTLVLR